MKRFVVTFSETVERQVIVEAKDEEMARYTIIDDRGSWAIGYASPLLLM